MLLPNHSVYLNPNMLRAIVARTVLRLILTHWEYKLKADTNVPKDCTKHIKVITNNYYTYNFDSQLINSQLSIKASLPIKTMIYERVKLVYCAVKNTLLIRIPSSSVIAKDMF